MKMKTIVLINAVIFQAFLDAGKFLRLDNLPTNARRPVPTNKVEPHSTDRTQQVAGSGLVDSEANVAGIHYAGRHDRRDRRSLVETLQAKTSLLPG
jgi:hypothetical protein